MSLLVINTVEMRSLRLLENAEVMQLGNVCLELYQRGKRGGFVDRGECDEWSGATGEGMSHAKNWELEPQMESGELKQRLCL